MLWTVIALVTLLLGSNSLTSSSSSGSSDAQCDCSVCHSRTGSLVYLSENHRVDGSGCSAFQIILSLAYCYYHGWNYGGITAYHSRHNVDIAHTLDFFFANRTFVYKPHVMTTIPHIKQAKKLTVTSFLQLEALTKTYSSFHNTSTGSEAVFQVPVLFHTSYIEYHDEKGYHFNPEFLTGLRKGASCGVTNALVKRNYFVDHPQPVKIALHLRLGDVIGNQTRTLPLSLYVDVIKTLQQLPIASQIHIFTSVLKAKGNGDVIANARKTFRDFPNTTLHVDYEDAANNTEQTHVIYAHLIHADVLMSAKSSFSFGSAIFSSNCVLYNTFWLRPLPKWIVMPKNTSDSTQLQNLFQSKLLPCIKHLPHLSHLFAS